MAEYGLAALITGGAAMKLAKVGLLAKFIVTGILAFKKGLIVVVLAIGGLVAKLLGRKRKGADAGEG